MDAERIISEIETLERMFALPDPRPLAATQLPAINQWHDERLSRNPWFQLWQRYGK